jgi:hypothetical protein
VRVPARVRIAAHRRVVSVSRVMARRRCGLRLIAVELAEETDRRTDRDQQRDDEREPAKPHQVASIQTTGQTMRNEMSYDVSFVLPRRIPRVT